MTINDIIWLSQDKPTDEWLAARKGHIKGNMAEAATVLTRLAKDLERDSTGWGHKGVREAADLLCIHQRYGLDLGDKIVDAAVHCLSGVHGNAIIEAVKSVHRRPWVLEVEDVASEPKQPAGIRVGDFFAPCEDNAANKVKRAMLAEAALVMSLAPVMLAAIKAHLTGGTGVDALFAKIVAQTR